MYNGDLVDFNLVKKFCWEEKWSDENGSMKKIGFY